MGLGCLAGAGLQVALVEVGADAGVVIQAVVIVVLRAEGGGVQGLPSHRLGLPPAANIYRVFSGYFADAFIQSDLQPFIHTPTAESTTQGPPRRVTASSSRAVRVRCLAQGHLDRGAGYRTSNPPVTS